MNNFGFYAHDDHIDTIRGSEYDWEAFDQFPGCQLVDVTKNRNLTKKTLAQIQPSINKYEGFGFNMFIMEKNKMTVRPIKTLMMNYA